MISFLDAAVRVSVPTASGESQRTIVDGVRLDLAQRRVAIIGANGSGKSTLLRLINGLVTPTSGRVEVDGFDVARQTRAVRALVGFVFTDPLSQLVMPTPIEDVELSLRRTIKGRRERAAHAQAILDARGLGHLAHSSVYDLSGGERQMVALASVLAVEPSVLVLDEPTTLLDLRNKVALADALASLDQQIVMATHDLDFAADCERGIVMTEGRVAFDGTGPAAVTAYRSLVDA